MGHARRPTGNFLWGGFIIIHHHSLELEPRFAVILSIVNMVSGENEIVQRNLGKKEQNPRESLDMPVQLSTDKRSLFVVLFLTAIVGVSFTATYGYEGMTDSLHRMLTAEGERHKDLFPMDSADIWGTIFTVLGLMVAASGGIGGGGILVPIFILVFGFAPRYAIPLSNFCILGSSVTNMLLNLVKRHPSADRPLVDWDLILVMEPLTMAGAVCVPYSCPCTF